MSYRPVKNKKGDEVRPAIFIPWSTFSPLRCHPYFVQGRFLPTNHLLRDLISQEYIYSGCNFVSLMEAIHLKIF